tara:strand:+ start:984 stop:1163 length:180 start_codon:yes stop_codon:yes gene_type:complete
MYGFEKGIAYLVIGVVILFSSKWIYQNAVSPNRFKNKVIMTVVGITIAMFIILDFADII